MKNTLKKWQLNTSLVFLFLVGIPTILFGVISSFFTINVAPGETIGSLLATACIGYFVFYIPIKAILKLKKMK